MVYGIFIYHCCCSIRVPVNMNPANSATGVAVNPTLTWSAVTGAVTYRVQVSTASDFSTGIVVDDSTLTTASKALNSLANRPCTTGMWMPRMPAERAYGNGVQLYHNCRSPGSAHFSAPTNDATGVAVSPTLAWTAVTGATPMSSRFLPYQPLQQPRLISLELPQYHRQ